MLSRFARDARGASALEFALIAPVMLVMFIGTVEVGQAVMAQRRTSHAVNTLGDLAARASTLHPSDVTDVFAAATDIMAPFPTSTLALKLTEVTGDSTGIAKVDWSDVSGSGFTASTVATTFTGLPTGLVAKAGDVVVIAEVKYTLNNYSHFVVPGGGLYTKRAYLRPRRGAIAHPAT